MRFSRPASLRRPKPLALLALAILFLALGINTVQRAAFLRLERTDFTVYQAAGRAVLDGTPLYEAQNARGWLYMYLPIFAVLMVPLAVLPKAVGAGIWYLLSLGMLLHMTWLGARLAEAKVGPSRWGTFWTFVAALLLAGWPWMSGLTRGQASVMLSWLTIVAVDCFLRESRREVGARWAGAFALALASAIRVFPALLGIWLLMQRRWRAILACLVAGVALVIVIPGAVFGPVQNMRLIHEWVTRIALPTEKGSHEENARYAQMMNPRIFKNQSIEAVAIRLIAPTPRADEDRRETLASRASLAIGAGLLLATILAAWGSRQRIGVESSALTAAAAFVMLTLFLPPVSWVHNYSVAVLPLAIVLVRALPAGEAPRRGHLAALAVWLFGVLSCFVEAGYSAGGFLWGGLALWAVLVADLFGQGRTEAATGTVAA